MAKAGLQDTVTGLLRQWRGGNAQALDQLMPYVYDELRRLARQAMRSEREGHTLQQTADRKDKRGVWPRVRLRRFLEMLLW